MAWIRNWFSNMLNMDHPYIEDGISYRTSEHYYQAQKIPELEKHLRKELSEMGP